MKNFEAHFSKLHKNNHFRCGMAYREHSEVKQASASDFMKSQNVSLNFSKVWNILFLPNFFVCLVTVSERVTALHFQCTWNTSRIRSKGWCACSEVWVCPNTTNTMSLIWVFGTYLPWKSSKHRHWRMTPFSILFFSIISFQKTSTNFS